jgi:hypothetical protein
MDTKELLEEQIAHVKVLRMLVAAEVERNKSAMEVEAALKLRLKTAEEDLRASVLDAYRTTGDKHPAPGVGIRIVKVMEYDPDKALLWVVKNNYLNCLQLEKKNFKKVAEGLGPEFVEIKEEPQATISREL